MYRLGKRFLAAAAVVGFAVAFIGAGVAFSTAEEPKAPDLADLRDAVKAAGKRGENVDEVRKALDALDAMLAKGFKPESGKTDPPAELKALRAAVEAAARKGENVEDIRKQLDEVERKLLGRVLAAPKPVPPVDDPNKPNPFTPPVRPAFPGGDFPFIPPRLMIPDFGGGIDPAAIQQAQDLMRKAMEMRLKEPNNEDALKLLEQAREMMMKAMAAEQGRFVFPDAGFARLPERFRLGVRMERLTPILVEQLGIEADRGIAVAEVIPGSPADKAGFKANDIVLEFAGKPVTATPEDFTQRVNEVKAGEKVDAVVLRKGKKTEVKGIELPDAGRAAPRPVPRVPLPGRLVPVFPNTLPDLGPKPVPVPDGENGRLFPEGRGKGGIAVVGGNGTFSIKAELNGVKFAIEGTTVNGKIAKTEVTIEEDGIVHRHDTREKVPAEYRDLVEKLLNAHVRQ